MSITPPMITTKSETNMSFPLSDAPDASHETGRDLLSQLPTELLLDIIKRCTDFTSLWSLINASPKLSSIFDAYALEIVETVLAITPPQSQILMRSVVHIRTKSFECKTLRRTVGYHTESFERPQQPLPTAISPALLRKFVGLAHKINVLAHCCMYGCIEKCMSVDSSVNLGPPSWVEEQGAILAFWKVQFYYEITVGQLNGRLGWSKQNIKVFREFPFTIKRFYGRDPDCQAQKLFTALDFIDELRALDNSKQTSHQPVNFGRSRSRRLFQLPNPPREYNFSCTCQPPPYSIDSGKELWIRQCQFIDQWAPPAWGIYLNWIHEDYVAAHGDLGHARWAFRTFRKLGFGLWGKEKINAMGCWSLEGSVKPAECVIARWRNILALQGDDDDSGLKNHKDFERAFMNGQILLG